MKNEVPAELLKVLSERSAFCLLSHSDPDGDCIGSELALAHYLRRIGKQVGLYSPGPFHRSEIRQYASLFEPRIGREMLDAKPAAIVLDCSSIERIADLAEDVRSLPTVVVDHHSAGKDFGEVHYIDPAAPAVTLLVQKIIESRGDEVDAEEARWIFFGFCTDTGFFRHLDTHDNETFEALARLSRAGASPKQTYRMIYGGRPLATRVLLGKLLSRAEEKLDGRVLVTYETYAEKQTFGSENRDSDTLYQLLQTVVGCEVVILIREEDEELCTVGLRSNSTVDVGALAKSFGGGGHKRAAGFELRQPRAEIQERLLSEVAKALT